MVHPIIHNLLPEYSHDLKAISSSNLQLFPKDIQLLSLHGAIYFFTCLCEVRHIGYDYNQYHQQLPGILLLVNKTSPYHFSLKVIHN